MAVFRIEKTKNYTVMSNHHLRNEGLSLKAKGLMSQMLSLPDNWDYTLVGLSHINLEKIDAIRNAIHELEKAGYVIRTRERRENGQLGGSVYIIREQPPDGYTPENTPAPPASEKPTLENPTQDNPTLENPTQLNKDISNKEKLNTDLSSKETIPFPSPREPERNGTETEPTSAIKIYRDIIRENIDYHAMIRSCPNEQPRIDEIADLILETLCSARKTMTIAGDEYPAELIKAKFLRLNGGHIEFVIDCLNRNTTEIRNIKKYLLAVLFNASSTIDSYYTALISHDTANGKI